MARTDNVDHVQVVRASTCSLSLFRFRGDLASFICAATLVELEASTKKGHGLYAIDGKTKWMDGLIVDVISNGLFPRRLRCQK